MNLPWRRAMAPFVPQPDWWQHLLEPGESVSTTYAIPHHWFAHVKASLYAVLSGLALTSAVLTIGREVSGLLSLIGVASGFWAWIIWQTTKRDKLIVTTVRVFKLTGLFSRTMAAMPLSKLVDLTVHEPWLGRMLGYGHFTFESAAQKQGLDSFRTVGNVLWLSKQIQSRAHYQPPRRGGLGGGGGGDLVLGEAAPRVPRGRLGEDSQHEHAVLPPRSH